MSIKRFDSVTINYSDKSNKSAKSADSILLTNVNIEFLAGILVGFRILSQNQNYTIHLKSKKSTIIIKQDTITSFLQSCLWYVGVDTKDLNNVTPLDNNLMGWWILSLPSLPNNESSSSLFYDLCVFKTKEFIEGFISIFKTFQREFRDYIAGPPFKYDKNNNKIDIKIEGYDIPQFMVQLHKPYAVVPFYEGESGYAYESDRKAEDFE